MDNNVHHLPTRAKPGRRRTRPIPQLPLAEIINFAPARTDPTVEKQLADYREALTTVTRCLLTAARAIATIDRK
ncbi:hypothetical protein C6Q14_28265 [Burkholderia ambifaria]|jgi:hypothetical protein|uniref:hypothetical protein n=1 Tax=Burkholderia ambifaria TaxID=152480 RepID=UPI000CFF568F|nr:hypothetical protein [Burkholderia ambifaria]PRF97441.1 hypothetical protein C6Q14_28265 [Burkholderia ambifaria]